MLMGVPVLARDAAAVAMTLGGAGLAIRGGSVAEVAETGRRLVEDAELRARVLAFQEKRAEAFAPAAVAASLRQYVESL
jgi:glycosyltransferase involved in cell wall biosynthesis